MANPSNAGPYEIGLDTSLAAGASRNLIFSDISTGPSNKRGYLRKLFGKRGGMDYIYVVNTSAELIYVNAGGGRTPIPPATSTNFDNGPFTSLTIENAGANPVATGTSDVISVEVGNGPRDENEGRATFSPRRAVSDMVPGLQL